uniref:Uncharacterized protein n=1 Tax=Arundo donax TaxID=35708 RepID=A0A0A9ADB5_ARUDO
MVALSTSSVCTEAVADSTRIQLRMPPPRLLRSRMMMPLNEPPRSGTSFTEAKLNPSSASVTLPAPDTLTATTGATTVEPLLSATPYPLRPSRSSCGGGAAA